jgi:tetrahydromethanopterin S-methyltransferase subunit B
MCLVAFSAVYLILDLPTTSDTHWREKLAQVDFLGAFALVTATSSLLLGLDRGSSVSWFDRLTLLYLAMSLPLAIIFIFTEMRVALHPFAPGRIILAPALAAAYLCNFFSVASYMAAIFYIPLFFQAVDGVSATTAGLYIVPGIVGSVTGSVFGGLVMQKTGKYYRLTILAHAFLIIAGNIPIFLFSGVVRNWTLGIIVGHVLWGFGGGIVITTTLIALIANADAADQAVATACSYLFRSLGSVVGLSISSTIVQQMLRTQLHRILGNGDEADTIVEKVRQSLAYIDELDSPTRELVRHCYQKAVNATFGMTIGLAVLALLSSFWIREGKLSK